VFETYNYVGKSSPMEPKETMHSQLILTKQDPLILKHRISKSKLESFTPRIKEHILNIGFS
jgi:hypothetical protein